MQIEKVEIRGVELLAVKNREMFADFLMNEQGIRTGKLVAINAEKIINSEKNAALRAVLEQAEYKYADGISIVYSIKKKYPQYHDIERVAGADLWETLMQKAAKLGVPVFLVGGTTEVLAKTATKLTACNVPIVGRQDGYFSQAEQASVIERIRQSGAKLVSVAMGTPKQEQFMQAVQQAYPECLLMGVGGTYDVFVGKVQRAPKIWQKLGLEWLFRLLQQPTRWQRQLNLIKYASYYWRNQL